MKRPKLDDYELFYMELPQTEYLDEIKTDENSEPATFNKTPNMSDQQVSALAQDQLDSLEEPPEEADTDQKSLFSKPVPQD